MQQVRKHLVRNILGRSEVDAEPVSHTLPETPQSLSHALNAAHGSSLVQHAPIRSQSLRLRTAQTLRAPATAVLRQHLVSNLVIRLQLGIKPLHLVPDPGPLHQPHDVPPLLGVQLAHRRSPQVRILVDRSLGSSNPRVDINIPAFGEPVGMAVRRAEEADLIRYPGICIIEDDIIALPILINATKVSCGIRDTRKPCL